MQKQSYLLFFFYSLSSIIMAQNTELKAIKSYYYEHKEQMEWCDKVADECNYYVLENIKNKYQRPISAIGHHFEKSTLWYLPDDEIEAPFYGEKQGVLIRKEERYENGLYQHYQEFFYKNKQVIFFFHQDNYKAYRYYFKDGQLLSFTETIVDTEEQPLVKDHGKLWKEEDWKSILELAINK